MIPATKAREKQAPRGKFFARASSQLKNGTQKSVSIVKNKNRNQTILAKLNVIATPSWESCPLALIGNHYNAGDLRSRDFPCALESARAREKRFATVQLVAPIPVAALHP